MANNLIYWDSAAFLAYFQEEEGRADLCRATLDLAQSGEIVIVTSTLSIAECLWLRNNPPVPKVRADVVRSFFRRSFIRVRNVSRSVAESAQDLVWDAGIKPKDAIHAATAIEAGASIIETFDEGFVAKSRTVGTPPLLIRFPIGTDQGRLKV